MNDITTFKFLSRYL